MKECFCMGPQDGQPLCPCRMRRVQVKDGRYVETIDHGPAPSDAEPRPLSASCRRFDAEIVKPLNDAPSVVRYEDGVPIYRRQP